MGINVALDGPSGAGKSTIARAAAERLGFVYVDTGALYRAIACHCIAVGADTAAHEEVIKQLEGLDIGLTYEDGGQRVLVGGEDVSDKIRTPEVSMAASAVSKYPEVREFLLGLQKDIAAKNDIIMDGRDIGTVVLPEAQVKLFLTASAEERADRRFNELCAKGEQVTYEQVLADINQRDYNDTHREIAPLKQAQDAKLIDSTHMTVEEAIAAVVQAVEDYKAAAAKPAEEKKTKKSCRREVMPVHPVKNGNKVFWFRQGFYTVVRTIVRGIFKIWFDLSYEGVENVPRDGGNIFASNHRSYGDPVFIALKARVPISYMAKEELFKQSIFFSLLIRAWGAFPVTRGTGDTTVVDTAIAKLESGRNLVIFPEGTRSKDGKVGKGKTGVALIAAVAQTNVIPVGINFEGEKLAFRKKVVVRYGKPIIPAELGVTDTSPKNIKKIKKEIMDSINELVH